MLIYRASHSENFMPPWNELRAEEKKVKKKSQNFLLGPHRYSSQNWCSTSFYLRPGVCINICMPRGVKFVCPPLICGPPYTVNLTLILILYDKGTVCSVRGRGESRKSDERQATEALALMQHYYSIVIITGVIYSAGTQYGRKEGKVAKATCFPCAVAVWHIQL